VALVFDAVVSRNFTSDAMHGSGNQDGLSSVPDCSFPRRWIWRVTA
jgi:hypothetical protein